MKGNIKPKTHAGKGRGVEEERGRNGETGGAGEKNGYRGGRRGKQQRERVKQGETDRRTERERIDEQTTAE